MVLFQGQSIPDNCREMSQLSQVDEYYRTGNMVFTRSRRESYSIEAFKVLGICMLFSLNKMRVT